MPEILTFANKQGVETRDSGLITVPKRIVKPPKLQTYYTLEFINEKGDKFSILYEECVASAPDRFTLCLLITPAVPVNVILDEVKDDLDKFGLTIEDEK